MSTTMFGSNVMYELAQLIRTLMPIFAAIGTISSIFGLWRIFTKWGRPGVLSLVPFVRGWVFAKDSNTLPRALYGISDGVIMVLTPIFYWIRAYGDLTAMTVHGFTFYVDIPMIIVTVIWAIAELVRFASKVRVSSNLVAKNGQKKGWVLSWVLFPKFSQIVWGFSNKFVKEGAE